MEKETECIRMGAPYDEPAFEALCREMSIWGTAQAALCAVFWRKGGEAMAESIGAGGVSALMPGDRAQRQAEPHEALATLREFVDAFDGVLAQGGSSVTVDDASSGWVSRARAALAAAPPPAQVPLSGDLLHRLFNTAQVPLGDMQTEAEAANWWRHFAGRVRNASR